MVFVFKKIYKNVLGTPKDWLFGTPPNGYMDGDLFYKWFEVIFLKHCHVRPAV